MFEDGEVCENDVWNTTHFFIVLLERFQASCYSDILMKNLWQKPQQRKTTLCGKIEMKRTFDTKITVKFNKWPFNSSRIHVCTIQYFFYLNYVFFLKHRPPIKVNWTHWFTHVWSWKVTYCFWRRNGKGWMLVCHPIIMFSYWNPSNEEQ